MSESSSSSPVLPPFDVEREKLEFERFKAKLDFRKFVLGSVFVALAVATIPPLFQLATAGLEYVKTSAERRTKQQQFRDDYIKEFINNALNQDIELRIRFAQYFARVSTDEYKKDWEAYHEDLRRTRTEIRSSIDRLEGEWSAAARSPQRNDALVEKLERNLAWAYKEVGYVEKNRSAATNPRIPELSSRQGLERELRSPPSAALVADLVSKGRELGTLQWMQYAIDELGVTAISGTDNNSRIMEYARFVRLDGTVTSDETPWAGLFVNFVLQKAGFDKFPTNPLLNRSWANWGEPATEPAYGTLAVFWRVSPQSGLGHVGFIVGIEGDNLSILGGAQNGAVSIASFPKQQLVALRRPPKIQ